ncbi:MAG: tRNA (adenine-N1)-methyltransferase [Thermoplasmataceae archaeon]
MILKNDEKTILYSEKDRKIGTGNSATQVPPNFIISPGDVINTRSGNYTAIDFQPPEFGNVCRRNAQIIQPHDAAYMIFRSGVRAGNTVLEAGAGSGSLSSFILWSIGKSGKLLTVDNNEENLNTTRENLMNFYDLSNWNPIVGDIRNYALEEKLDAVFLDIPDPWNAVSNAADKLKMGGFITTYSPNFNQMEKTVVEMKRLGMFVVENTEIIKRNMLVREGSTRPDHNSLWHTAFITFAVKRSMSPVKL